MRFEFGTPVQATAVVGRLRRFLTRNWKEEELVVDRSYLSLGHGRRAHLDQFYGDSKFDGFEVLAEPESGRLRYSYTKVSLVRVPMEVVRDPWVVENSHVFPPKPGPMQGVVIGETQRQCGIVTTEEHGGQWENRGSIPVVTVAMRTERSASVYDVHPDDIEERKDS